MYFESQQIRMNTYIFTCIMTKLKLVYLTVLRICTPYYVDKALKYIENIYKSLQYPTYFKLQKNVLNLHIKYKHRNPINMSDK